MQENIRKMSIQDECETLATKKNLTLVREYSNYTGRIVSIYDNTYPTNKQVGEFARKDYPTSNDLWQGLREFLQNWERQHV